jgi:hypothetical protein
MRRIKDILCHYLQKSSDRLALWSLAIRAVFIQPTILFILSKDRKYVP